MNRSSLRISPLAYRGIYFFMFVLVFWPAADLLTNAWPTQFGNVQWRYGFMGLMGGFLHTPILGITIAMIVAFVLGHTRMLRVLSGLSLAGAVLLGLVLVFFPLDVIQVRSVRPPAQSTPFLAGALIAELKHLTSFVALLLIGLGGWRTARTLGSERAAKSGGTPDLVMKPPTKGRSKGSDSS